MSGTGGVCLALWLVGFSSQGALIGALGHMPGSEPFSATYVLFQLLIAITSWSAVVVLLALGSRRLNFTNAVLAYAGEAVLPFYLLHQTIIQIVGWSMLKWEMGILPKYLIVAVVSFALILAVYDLVVRRVNIVRVLFGMRSKREPPGSTG